MKPYIYLRGLRHVDLSVFCVESGPRVRHFGSIFKWTTSKEKHSGFYKL